MVSREWLARSCVVPSATDSSGPIADARLIIDHLMSTYPQIPGVMETMKSVGNIVENEIPQGNRQGGGCDQEGHEGEQEQRERLRSMPWR